MPEPDNIPAEARERMQREGWASMEEQQKYWDDKAKLDALLQGLDAFGDFLGDINNAMGRLRMKLEAIKGGDEKH